MTTTTDMPPGPPAKPGRSASPVLVLGILGILGVIALVVVVVVLLVASGSGPTITVEPAAGAPGSVIRVTGSGFLPDESVEISAGSTIIARATADTEGAFAVDLTIPATLGPVTAIEATGRSSDTTATAAFTVAVATVPPLLVETTVVVPFDWMFDADQGAVMESGGDVWFQFVSAADRFLQPDGGALLAVAGATAPGYQGCAEMALADGRIDLGRQFDGPFLCLRTSEGRVAELEIVGPTSEVLEMRIRTYAD